MGWLTSTGDAFRHFFRKRETREPKPKPDLMIVRRGLSPSFYFFCHVFAKEHNLAVVPDRRVRDRRRRQRATATIDRRALERRGEPVRWPFEDFIIVRDPRRTPRPDEA
ncbi:MAG: hypothetical protein WD873_06755 [Candidatus Hydrogenedentales bacterium]